MSKENTTLNRLEAAQTKLDKLQRKINRGTTITLVVAALLLLLPQNHSDIGNILGYHK